MRPYLPPAFMISQILYGLLGLAFLMTLFASTFAHSEVARINGDTITMSGEVSSIQGDGFALKHENGLTLVSLEDISPDEKAALSDADLIKVGNMVTVSGEMDKGAFNKPIIKAHKLSIVEKLPEQLKTETVQ